MLNVTTSMHADLMLILIAATIAVLVLLIMALLFASIVRRVLNDRMYRKLDALRQEYGRRLSQALELEGVAVQKEAFLAKPGSLAWQAIEDVLFAVVSDGKFAEKGRTLFQRLGYMAFYESGCELFLIPKTRPDVSSTPSISSSTSLAGIPVLSECKKMITGTGSGLVWRALSKTSCNIRCRAVSPTRQGESSSLFEHTG